MNYTFLTKNNEVIKIDLFDKDDTIIVNEPDNIVAFQSENHTNRKDFIFDELKLKKYKKKSKIYGKSSLYIKSSNNSTIKIFEMHKNNPFIFNFNILFYTKKINIKYVIENINNVAFKNNLFRYECSGEGLVGYYAEGNIIEINLAKNETIFIHQNSLLGYNKNIKCEFKTYGNAKAALNMEHHYKFTGAGKVLLQTQSLLNDIKKINNSEDNIFKRFIKEFIPGANIFLK
jgi:hypothetical protein